MHVLTFNMSLSDRRARRDRVRESLEAFRKSNPGQENLNSVLADMVMREKLVACVLSCINLSSYP